MAFVPLINENFASLKEKVPFGPPLNVPVEDTSLGHLPFGNAIHFDMSLAS